MTHFHNLSQRQNLTSIPQNVTDNQQASIGPQTISNHRHRIALIQSSRQRTNRNLNLETALKFHYTSYNAGVLALRNQQVVSCFPVYAPQRNIAADGDIFS